MGIAKMLYDEFYPSRPDPQEAKKHFYLVDKQGLLFDDIRPTKQSHLPVNELEFSLQCDELTNLLAIVKAVHPTMIGTSTQPGSFDEVVVKEVAAHTPRPVIFPLSNPTKLQRQSSRPSQVD